MTRSASSRRSKISAKVSSPSEPSPPKLVSSAGRAGHSGRGGGDQAVGGEMEDAVIGEVAARRDRGVGEGGAGDDLGLAGAPPPSRRAGGDQLARPRSAGSRRRATRCSRLRGRRRRACRRRRADNSRAPAAFSPKPRYSARARLGGAWRTSRKARAETAVLMSRSRPSQCDAAEIEAVVVAAGGRGRDRRRSRPGP